MIEPSLKSNKVKHLMPEAKAYLVSRGVSVLTEPVYQRIILWYFDINCSLCLFLIQRHHRVHHPYHIYLPQIINQVALSSQTCWEMRPFPNPVINTLLDRKSNQTGLLCFQAENSSRFSSIFHRDIAAIAFQKCWINPTFVPKWLPY
jgi:hypothetical protein